MKLKIASMLLGENVRAILDKIQSHQDDASDYKSRLKKLLLRKQELNQQLSDLDKQKANIDRQIATLRNEVNEKCPLQKSAEQIIQTEKDIISKEKEICDCTSNIKELQQSIVPLQKEIVDLKSRKSLLETEKRKYEGEINIEDTISDDLQVINSEIVNLQEWLRIHSVDLTQLESKITELIHALEDDKPIETPQEDIKEDAEEVEKELEDDTTNEESTDKKEPDEGKRNETVEPPTRKKRDHKIKEVFDIETGETLYAEDFFKKTIDELQRWRTIFQHCISQGNRRFVCPKCLEMIRISGRGDERGVPAIFTHKNDSVSCKRTTTGQSIEDINRKKYGLFGQSQRHKDLKKELYNCLCDTDCLSLGVRNVEMEKRVYSTLPFFSWRQPDVQIEYEGHKIVFEIQLSTTFLSVITERDTFYRLNDYYIIWIFNFDNNRKYVDLDNLAMKDIYFANKRNAFIFDDEAREWSRESGQFVLKCNWVEPDSTWHYANTEKRFGGERVTLDMLKFDNDTHKLYYYDAETPYFEKHPDIANRLIAEQKTRENYIKELELRAQEKEIRKQEAIEQMMRDGGHVIPFEEKGHYGFKYGVTTIIEPHFTSFVPLEDGSFIVGFNKKEGLVSQYGEMIRDCEYKRIHPLSGNAYVAEDKTNYWLCNLNIPICKHSPNDCVMHRMINERVEQVDIHNNAKNDSSFCCYIIDGNNLFVKNDNKDIVFVDYEGNKIVDEEFNEIEFLPNHVICLQRKKDNLWNNMDYEGFFLHEWTKYMSFEPWSNGLRIGKYSNCYHQALYDIIDVNSNVISGGFSSIGQLIDGKAKVSLDAFSGEVDESGEILPERSVSFSNGYQVVKKLGYWELLNNLGNRILGLNEKIEFVNQLDDSIFVIQKRGLRGLADSTGMILPCKYESIELWSSEILKIGSHNIQFLTDKMGKCQISQKYNKIGKLEDGKAKVSLHGQEAYINSIGKLIIYKQNLTPKITIRKGFYWEMLDNKGNTVLGLDEKIESIEKIDEDIVVIQKKGLMGLADSTGIILPCEYNSIKLWSPGILHIIQSKVHFLTDRTGKHRISQCYGNIDKLENGKARVSIGPLIGYINDKGLQIPEHEIALEDGSIKYMFMGKWRIRSAEGEQLLKRHYAEIASYKGFYCGIDDGKIEITECKTSNTVYFFALKYGEEDNSFLFKSDGLVLHVLKSKVKSIWKGEIPDSVNLTITKMNIKNAKVYAEPYIH